MAVACSFQFSWESGIRKDHGCNKRFKGIVGRDELHVLSAALSSHASRQNVWSIHISDRVYRPLHSAPCRCNVFKCHSFLLPGNALKISSLKPSLMELTRSYNALQGSPLVIKLVPAIGIIIFAVWGLGPLLRQGRKFLLHKNDSNWGKSGTYHILTSYLQPLLLWTGALLICRAFDPVVPPSEAGQVVKQRLLTFVRSLSTVLAFAYCLSSVIQQAQSFFMETNGTGDTRNMGFQFAGKAVYSAVWVAAASLFMELLGFSTQRWLTAGGLGTVLLTLAGREIFTNFLSSAMIHATRPFVLNEWIQTKIEGYEVSGTVEHIGWWSPTVIRGDDREAVHIPNHKFTVNVVRNLSQKTHWRIKTHLAISHLDVSKINNIVSDMRKVLAKNPQVEQQRLHRRVFLDVINPGNQALLILVSCFVKTSRFEEYLCVKEAILLDLLKVISHHQARLATPIRTVQKIHNDIDLENVPFADTIFTHGPGVGAAPNRPLLLIEPPYKIHGEEKTKTHPTRASTDSAGKSTPEPKSDPKVKLTSQSIPSIDGKDADISSTDSKVQTSVSDGKQIKKPGLGNTKQNVEIDSQVSVLETGCEKPTSSSNSSQTIQEVEKPPVVQPPALRASLEENIVLGVALDGSKRTLPIEEEMEPPPSATEAKELATSRNGNGPPAAENDKKGQTPSPRAKSGG